MLKKFSQLHLQPKILGTIAPKGEKIRTLQSFKKDTDVNTIMKKFRETGTLPVPTIRKPFYGDFRNADDFLSAQNKLIAARASFELLPSHLRHRFNNNPAELFEWLADENNNDEAIKLKLRPAPEPPPAPPVPPAPPPPAPPA